MEKNNRIASVDLQLMGQGGHLRTLVFQRFYFSLVHVNKLCSIISANFLPAFSPNPVYTHVPDLILIQFYYLTIHLYKKSEMIPVCLNCQY